MDSSSSVTGSERVLLVLAALASQGRAVTVSDMLDVTGLARSTLYRQIALLKRWGFVSENGGCYAPGPISLQLALGFDLNSLLVEASRDEMQKLARTTQESVGLLVAVNQQVVCLEMAESAHALRCSFEKGRAVTLKAGASAKSLLAFMPDKARDEALAHAFAGQEAACAAMRAELQQIRERGYATSDSEVDQGVWGISAPLFRRTGRTAVCCASITLMAPSSRIAGREERLAMQTLRAAHAISERLKAG